MWWLEQDRIRRFACRLTGIACVGGLAAGCFQPLYGEHSLTNSPAIGPALAGVDVNQIPAPSGSSEARVAVEVRNQLLFDLTGGAAPPPPTHRLAVRRSSNRMSVIVDITTGRPNLEDFAPTLNSPLPARNHGNPFAPSKLF